MPTLEKKVICIISYTSILREPRVLRQAEYFAKKKYDVVLVGIFHGSKDISTTYTVVPISFVETYHNRSLFFKLVRFLDRSMIYFLNIFGLGLEKRYNLHYGNIHLNDTIKKYSFNSIICHDYLTVPLGIKLKKNNPKAKIIVDCHEHFLSQNLSQYFLKNIKWFFQDYFFIKYFEKKMLTLSNYIITVSEGISKSLLKQYKLSSLPMTIRNIPVYEKLVYRPVQKNKIKILYHGLVKPGRFLENLIEACVYLDPSYEINIRGPGTPEYIESLKSLSARLGIETKVNFLDAVDLKNMIKEANLFDIGYFVWDGTGIQHKHVLPNKFFEYIMAGMALCVSDLPEMSEIVKGYSLGILISNSSARTIAGALNNLNHEQINVFKKNSLKAAKELNWAIESKKLNFIGD